MHNDAKASSSVTFQVNGFVRLDGRNKKQEFVGWDGITQMS